MRRIPDDPTWLVLGALAMLIGLTLMVARAGDEPFREALADPIARCGHPAWVMRFAFALGFGSTVVEPALAAVATQFAAAMTAKPGFPATEAQRGALALRIRYGVSRSGLMQQFRTRKDDDHPAA